MVEQPKPFEASHLFAHKNVRICLCVCVGSVNAGTQGARQRVPKLIAIYVKPLRPMAFDGVSLLLCVFFPGSCADIRI